MGSILFKCWTEKVFFSTVAPSKPSKTIFFIRWHVFQLDHWPKPFNVRGNIRKNPDSTSSPTTSSEHTNPGQESHAAHPVQWMHQSDGASRPRIFRSTLTSVHCFIVLQTYTYHSFNNPTSTQVQSGRTLTRH
jgi:hypothetical protein